jgi:hypothetical protein
MLRATIVLVVLLFAALAAAQEDGEEQQKQDKPSGAAPEKTEPAQEKDTRELHQGEARGTLVFSDGSSISGIVHSTGFKPIEIYDTQEKKFKNLPLEHIANLKVVVTKQEMVREWRFKEESKDEKVYSGKEFPRKDYEVHVTLRGGQEVHGTCKGVLYIESGEDKTRFWLKHYDRGKTDETLDDLVHVQEIKFANPAEKAVDCRISGTIKADGEVEDVIAVQHRYKMFVKGRVNKKTGEYLVKDLLPGYYDLVVVTKSSVFTSPGMKGEDFAENNLSDQDKADIAKRVWEIKDFFEEKKVLHAVGNVKRAKVIVKTARKSKTSLEKQGDLPLVFFHIEYWVMHRVGERWLVDWRIQLLREKGEQETKKDTRTFVNRPELADRKMETTGTQMSLDFNAVEAEGGDEGDVIGR